MKLKEKILALSDEKKNRLLLAAIGVVGTLSCLPLCLLPEMGIGAALGFLAGSLLEIFSYFSICYGSSLILGKENGKSSKLGLVVLFYLLRFALIAGLLVLAAFCTFSWKAPYLNFWTSFVALLPVYPLLIATGLLRARKTKKGQQE